MREDFVVEGRCVKLLPLPFYPALLHLYNNLSIDPERLAKGIFRSHFFPRPSVCPSVCKFCKINFFFWKIELWDTSYGHLWCPSEPEVTWANRKWTGSKPEVLSGSEVEFEGSTSAGRKNKIRFRKNSENVSFQNLMHFFASDLRISWMLLVLKSCGIWRRKFLSFSWMCVLLLSFFVAAQMVWK